MIWIKYIYRTLRREKLHSLCVVVTTLVFCLLLLSFGVLNAVLSPESVSTDRNNVLVTNKAAPLIQGLPVRMQSEIKSMQGVQSVVPFTIIVVNYKDNNAPIAMVATDIDDYIRYNDIAITSKVSSPPTVQKNRAFIGKELSEKYNLKVGENLNLKIFKSLIPHTQDNISLYIEGIFSFEAGGGSEMQVFTDIEFTARALFPSQGEVSAFIVSTEPGFNYDDIAKSIDIQTSNSPYPTLSGSEQIVATGLMSKFIEIRTVTKYVLIICGVMFSVILIGASHDISLRDRSSYEILYQLGYSRLQIECISFAKWMLLNLVGLTVGLGQIIVAYVLLQPYINDAVRQITPRFSDLLFAVLYSLVLVVFAFAVPKLLIKKSHS